MSEAFWKRVMLGGGVLAATFIYWPAISEAFHGDWIGAGIAFAVPTLLGAAIYWQTRKRPSR